MKHDFFVAGRWINHKRLREVLTKLRENGKTAYCCIENEYDGDGIKQHNNPDQELKVSNIEHVDDWQTNKTFREMFEKDLEGLKKSKAFVMILPAGSSTHAELGIAYGMGKKCYGIGVPEKVETLYLIFDEIFPTIDDFLKSEQFA